MNTHHTQDMAINSIAKMVMASGTTLPSGNSVDRTPEWVRQTIKRMEADLEPKIKKYKKKRPTFKKYLLHNHDEKRWEVWEKGLFGRDKFLAAEEYRRDAEQHL